MNTGASIFERFKTYKMGEYYKVVGSHEYNLGRFCDITRCPLMLHHLSDPEGKRKKSVAPTKVLFKGKYICLYGF